MSDADDLDFRSIDVTADVYAYLVDHGTAPDATYEAIKAETARAAGPYAGMQIGPDQYALLTLHVRLVGARFAVEVGTFTGTIGEAGLSGTYTTTEGDSGSWSWAGPAAARSLKAEKTESAAAE